MYGGRVIDSYDRRIVGTYMDEYMGDFLFDTFQPFRFYHDHIFTYVIPKDGEKAEYMSKHSKFVQHIQSTCAAPVGLTM